MKASNVGRVGVLILTLAVLGVGAAAAPTDRNGDQSAYVMVTGSLIPQKIKIHRIGTKTASPLHVYSRQDIDRTGRVTTAGVLAQDPSLTVISGTPGGNH